MDLTAVWNYKIFLFVLVMVANCNGKTRPKCTDEQMAKFYTKITKSDTGKHTGSVIEDKTAYLSIMIIDMFNLDEKQSSLQLSLFTNLSWTKPDLDIGCDYNHGVLFRHAQVNMWSPLFSIVGIRKADVLKSPDALNQFTVATNGQVTWVVAMDITVGCSMDFALFPFDHMSCTFMINPAETFIQIVWGKVVLGPRSTFASHQIKSVSTSYQGMDSYEDSLVEFNSMPVCNLQFERYVTFYVLSGYIPNMLTVVVAWVGFSISPAAAPARVTIGVTSLVALVVQHANLMTSVPKVGYMKVIDFWMLMCALFITFSLLEFAYISSLRRSMRDGSENKSIDQKCAKIDKICRIGYPVVFILTMIAYFMYSMLG